MPRESRSGENQSVQRRPIEAIAATDRLARSDPKRGALRCGTDELTCGEPRLTAVALAMKLRERGAQRAVVWGKGGFDWATAIVAILRAGSTYPPLDRSLLSSRTSFMIEHSPLCSDYWRRQDGFASPFQGKDKANRAIHADTRGALTLLCEPDPVVGTVELNLSIAPGALVMTREDRECGRNNRPTP